MLTVTVHFSMLFTNFQNIFKILQFIFKMLFFFTLVFSIKIWGTLHYLLELIDCLSDKVKKLGFVWVKEITSNEKI